MYDMIVTNLDKKYDSCLKKSRELNEYMDCAVRAVAMATHLSYEEAREHLRWAGRKYRSRTPLGAPQAVIDKLGYDVVCVKNLVKAKTVRTFSRDPEVEPSAVYLIGTRGHILTAHGYKVFDWADGRMKRIKEIYKIIRR